MPVVAIIPVKSFRSAKGRLADTVDTDTRRRLSVALAGHVATAAEKADLVPLVVTSDAEVAEWAASTGFPALGDPGAGLDVAASTGVEWAMESRSSWVVLHADLPLLTVGDVTSLASSVSSGKSILAPSADGGTSAVGSSGRFEFAYGPGSFGRHLTRLPEADVVVSPGLAHDIDSPDDLTTALAAPGGRWLSDAMR